MQKIQGVESVNVSLNQGLASIRLHPDNRVQLEQIVRVVTNNGFTPKEAKIAAVGSFLSTEGKLRFQIAGTDQIFDVIFDSGDHEAKARKEIGRNLSVEGVIPISRDKRPEALRVRVLGTP
jgi:hypothetical protein